MGEVVRDRVLGLQQHKGSGYATFLFILWESNGWRDGTRGKYEKEKINGQSVDSICSARNHPWNVPTCFREIHS